MANHETLIDLFQGFRRQGERCACVQRSDVRRRVMSYAELDSCSRRMATLLAGLGLEPGDRLAIWAANSPWWAVAFWGAVLRGVVLVPIDVAADAERARSIVEHSGARLVVQSALKPQCAPGMTLGIEGLRRRLDGVAELEEAAASRPDDLAELIYTSGTTGQPKGVMLSHRNLLGNLAQLHAHLPLVDDSFRFLSLLPLSHMFEQMAGFLVPLSCGAPIVYLATLKPSAIMEAFAEEDISAVIAVPRLLQLLRGGIEAGLAARGATGLFEGVRRLAAGCSPAVRRLLFAPLRRRFGARFRLFVSGGAPLDPELFRFWNDLGFTVLEGYGLTECSPVLTAATIGCQRAGTVGPPLPGIELRIAGGEVQARGANIFSGYYRNPQATAEAFTDDGWFRSGDIGVLDGEGWLQIRGRLKEMIVTAAGVNVYPDEIERLLNGLPGVREACVLGLDRGQGEEVHAVLIPDGSGRPLAGIVAEANTLLDPLQRITGFSAWPEPEFPRTTTLKVRKFLLREQLQRQAAPQAAAADRLTALIAASTACSADEVREESFLVAGLGLTSIGRLELVSAIEREFRLDLDEALIGPQTTVAQLREMVRTRQKLTVSDHFRSWCSMPALRPLRWLADHLLHFPLLGLFCRVEVAGLEHLAGIEGPVLFASNHVSYLDQPVIMRALPPRWRYRTATAAWAEFFFLNFSSPLQRLWKRLAYEYCSLAVHIFPLSQVSGFRRTLAHMGRLADQGISLLVFPEGERTLDGQLLPFRHGLGIMAAGLELELVPLRIHGLEQVLPRGSRFPRRGRVRVVIGAPLRFQDESPAEIVELVRRSIEAL